MYEEVMICLFCGKVIPETKANRKKKIKVCNNRCRVLLTRQNMEEENRIVKIVSKPTHKRRCKVCNKLCWPNYFYCTEHHYRISRYTSGSLSDANDVTV
jgi:hypothetical protein